MRHKKLLSTAVALVVGAGTAVAVTGSASAAPVGDARYRVEYRVEWARMFAAPDNKAAAPIFSKVDGYGRYRDPIRIDCYQRARIAGYWVRHRNLRSGVLGYTDAAAFRPIGSRRVLDPVRQGIPRCR